jgi:hypothetical protein
MAKALVLAILKKEVGDFKCFDAAISCPNKQLSFARSRANLSF